MALIEGAAEALIAVWEDTMITPSVGAIEGLVAVIAGWMERRDRVAVPDVAPAVADDPAWLSRRSRALDEPSVVPPLALPAE